MTVKSDEYESVYFKRACHFVGGNVNEASDFAQIAVS